MKKVSSRVWYAIDDISSDIGDNRRILQGIAENISTHIYDTLKKIDKQEYNDLANDLYNSLVLFKSLLMFYKDDKKMTKKLIIVQKYLERIQRRHND